MQIHSSHILLGTNTWLWPDENKKQWDHVDGGYEKFCALWYNQETPYSVNLGLVGTNENKPVIYMYSSNTFFRDNEILVTDEYHNMYYRVLERATDHYRRVVLITGQPGIGTFRFRAPLPNL